MTKEIKTREDSAVEKVAAAPTWLKKAAKEDSSRDALKEHLVLPQLRVVPMQPGENMRQYKEQYGEGALVVTPAGIGIAPHDTWIKVVPMFFYTEYRKWHDRDDKDTNAVVERTTDPNSDVARRAKSEALRQEVYGDPDRKVQGKPQPFMYQYVETLCFIVTVYEGPNRGLPAVLEFSRGSFWKGKEFSSAALMRQVDGVECPLWTQVWEIQTTQVTRKGYTWWAVEFRNPADGQLLITEKEADKYLGQHETQKEAYEAKKLVVDLTDADNAVDAVVVEVDTSDAEADGM